MMSVAASVMLMNGWGGGSSSAVSNGGGQNGGNQNPSTLYASFSPLRTCFTIRRNSDITRPVSEASW